LKNYNSGCPFYIGKEKVTVGTTNQNKWGTRACCTATLALLKFYIVEKFKPTKIS